MSCKSPVSLKHERTWWAMTGWLKQDRVRSHTGHWQTAGEQTITAEQLTTREHQCYWF